MGAPCVKRVCHDSAVPVISDGTRRSRFDAVIGHSVHCSSTESGRLTHLLSLIHHCQFIIGSVNCIRVIFEYALGLCHLFFLSMILASQSQTKYMDRNRVAPLAVLNMPDKVSTFGTGTLGHLTASSEICPHEQKASSAQFSCD